MRKDSHRAGKLPYAQILSRSLESSNVALCLRIPVRDLESKRDGFGMNAMGAPHHRRVFEFPRAAFQHLSQALEVLRDQPRRLLDKQRLCGVDHLIRGKGVMKPACIRANDL